MLNCSSISGADTRLQVDDNVAGWQTPVIASATTYDTDFLATRTNVLEFEVQRLVVDDHCLVTEGLLKQIYPGAEAIKIGIAVDDVYADCLVVFRQLLLWPVDENGLIEGEDSYNPRVVSVTKLSREDLPQAYVDLAG